jgi:hypothetical protein
VNFDVTNYNNVYLKETTMSNSPKMPKSISGLKQYERAMQKFLDELNKDAFSDPKKKKSRAVAKSVPKRPLDSIFTPKTGKTKE